MIRPSRHFFTHPAHRLSRNALSRHIGHPIGFLAGENDAALPRGQARHDRSDAGFVGSAALSHCTTCGEGFTGGWVDGPCGWDGCELRGASFHEGEVARG